MESRSYIFNFLRCFDSYVIILSIVNFFSHCHGRIFPDSDVVQRYENRKIDKWRRVILRAAYIQYFDRAVSALAAQSASVLHPFVRSPVCMSVYLSVCQSACLCRRHECFVVAPLDAAAPDAHVVLSFVERRRPAT